MSLDWKEYYAKHKETYTKYRNEHREERRAYDREYYQLNKEKVKENTSKWKEANRDKLHEVITCECGGHYIFRNKTPHMRTTKHQKYIANSKSNTYVESSEV